MPDLKILPDKAIALLNERIDDFQSIKKNPHGPEYYDFVRWCSKTYAVIDEIYPAGDPHTEDIRTIALQNCSCNSELKALILIEAYHVRLLDYIREIEDSIGCSGMRKI
ncbi:MAG: hypothetical protein WC586_10280 [Methanoregula sp.]